MVYVTLRDGAKIPLVLSTYEALGIFGKHRGSTTSNTDGIGRYISSSTRNDGMC
jgi:hypothetical protein